MTEAEREALVAVAEALRPLHKSLLDVTRQEYEREHGPVPGPGVLFQLVVRHPTFEWLRPMSGLMAHIDELLDDLDAFAAAEAAALRARVERLILEGEHPAAKRHLEILQAEPDVVLAHAALRRALSRL